MTVFDSNLSKASQSKITFKIMVVEDEALVARHLQIKLTEQGYTLTPSASTGHDAIATARDHMPDLVLMDINLRGDMRGTEAAAFIYERFGIPIIFLTAHTDAQTLEEAKHARPLSYLIKPFDDAELHTNVAMALHKSLELKEFRGNTEYVIRILENTSNIIMYLDEDALINYTTPALHKQLGWDISDVLGKPAWFATHEKDIILLSNALENVRQNQSETVITYRHKLKNIQAIQSSMYKSSANQEYSHKNNHVWLEATLSPAYELGQYAGTIINARINKQKDFHLINNLQQLAYSDRLTGLANEAYMRQCFATCVASNHLQESPTNNFLAKAKNKKQKTINFIYPHFNGFFKLSYSERTKTLRQIAQRLSNTLHHYQIQQKNTLTKNDDLSSNTNNKQNKDYKSTEKPDVDSLIARLDDGSIGCLLLNLDQKTIHELAHKFWQVLTTLNTENNHQNIHSHISIVTAIINLPLQNQTPDEIITTILETADKSMQNKKTILPTHNAEKSPIFITEPLVFS